MFFRRSPLEDYISTLPGLLTTEVKLHLLYSPNPLSFLPHFIRRGLQGTELISKISLLFKLIHSPYIAC